ncbi:RNA-directed DNA polymerase from mobile element jockey [Trichonephila clavipes]|nr:RNA-directed DNA polymerase from mobile element jockey [Trichonephila clavipes]
MVSWEYLWPTLCCRREAGVSPLLSIGWWYLSSVSPKRHCCRVSAADKGCRVYPLDPRPDAVALYSGGTSGKRRAWFWPDDRHTASLVGLRGGWSHARMKLCCALMDPMLMCPGKGLVLPKPHIDETATHVRFLLLSLPNNAMSQKSPFAIQKALIAIGGEPKSVKRLRSGNLLIETMSALQTNSFLLAKTFLNSPVSISPHKSLNTYRGVISEPDLLTIPDADILEGFSDYAVIQCQRFGHSQTACRDQLTCSRCATVWHSSTDFTLEPKCINCSQPHSADSKLCSKWKTEKQIQEIKTNRNITYLEAQKLIAPPISQSYAQATKSSKVSATTQTDENITKRKCPPLKLLQQPSSTPKPNISQSIPSTSASSAQAYLLTSTSPIADISESEPVNPIPNNVHSTFNISAFASNSDVQHTSASTFIQDSKQKAKTRARKWKKEQLKKMNDAIIETKMAPPSETTKKYT